MLKKLLLLSALVLAAACSNGGGSNGKSPVSEDEFNNDVAQVSNLEKGLNSAGCKFDKSYNSSYTAVIMSISCPYTSSVDQVNVALDAFVNGTDAFIKKYDGRTVKSNGVDKKVTEDSMATYKAALGAAQKKQADIKSSIAERDAKSIAEAKAKADAEAAAKAKADDDAKAKQKSDEELNKKGMSEAI